MDVFTKHHDSPFCDFKQKSCEVVKLTRTIIKTALISHLHDKTESQTLLLGCNRIKFTEAQNQPGDSSSCQKSVSSRQFPIHGGLLSMIAL